VEGLFLGTDSGDQFARIGDTDLDADTNFGDVILGGSSKNESILTQGFVVSAFALVLVGVGFAFIARTVLRKREPKKGKRKR